MSEQTQKAVFLEHLRDSVPTIKAVSTRPRHQLFYIRDDLRTHVARGVTAKSIWLDLKAIGIDCHYKTVVSALKAIFPDIYQAKKSATTENKVANAGLPEDQAEEGNNTVKSKPHRMNVDEMTDALSDYTGKV